MSESERVTERADTLIAGSPAVPADLAVGAVLKDTYAVQRKLGEGGMGAVYLAEHTTIHKKVAIKVLSPAFLHRAELSERFLREARAAAAIASPHVIEIFDFGTAPGGAGFFVMEYLQGEDLAALLRREGPLTWARARGIVLQLCDALQAAHDRGIYHRDMKPENVFLVARGGEDFVKVLDFGIAKVASDEAEGGPALTRTGMIFGTPEYMSPEQAQGAAHDHRVDIYATGVLLFQLLTGELPFTGENFMNVLTRHMFEPPPRPRALHPGADVPEAVEAIILKALQKDANLRFQSMRELAAAVAAVGTGAAPVAVVAERLPTLPRPGEAIGFRDHGGAARRRRWLIGAARRRRWLIGAAVAAAALAAAPALLDDEPPPSRPASLPEDPADELAAPLVAPPPLAPEAAPPAPPARAHRRVTDDAAEPLELPPPPTSEPPVPKAILRIDTGDVAATVLDAQGAELGTTDAPLTLPRSDAPVKLTLRAEGREDREIEVVLDRDEVVARVDLPHAPEPTPEPPDPPPDPEPPPDEASPE